MQPPLVLCKFLPIFVAFFMVTTLQPAALAGGGQPGVELPFQFQAGQPARADEVNANFVTLETGLGDVQAVLDAQLARIDDLEAALADRDAQVAQLSGQVTLLMERFESLLAAEQADVDALAQVIPHLSLVDLEIGGGESRSTVRFEGVNLQVVSGSGATNGDPSDPRPPLLDEGEVNGLGNLIIGYNEGASATDSSLRNGSHNLIVGFEQSYPSFGGVVFGRNNRVVSPCATVTGGFVNVAMGLYASVSGGELNETSEQSAAVGGGQGNDASGYASFVAGGQSNQATGFASSVAGGFGNQAQGTDATVSGGRNRTAAGTHDWRAGALFEEE